MTSTPPLNPTPSSPDTPEWFQSDLNAHPIAPTARHRPRWRAILVTVLVCIVAVGGILAVAYSARQASCLTADDFVLLTGNDYYTDEEFVPAASSYTYSVEFAPASADYIADQARSGTSAIARIGHFHTEHPDKSILITISADYGGGETLDIANARIDKLVAALIAAGIQDDTIFTSVPAYLDSQDDVITNESTPPVATIDVSSAQGCAL